MRRASFAVPALFVAVAAGGCGNDRTQPPDTGFIPAPKAFRDAVYTQDGVRFRAPTNWRVLDGDGSHVATVAIGDGQVGVWRYPRSEPLPETRSQLGAARDALVEQVRRRDPSFKLESTRLVMKPGIRAVELIGTGTNLTNGDAVRKVRSLHAYGHGAEIVVDAFAPVKDFARVDEQTFGPLTRSLRLLAPAS